MRFHTVETWHRLSGVRVAVFGATEEREKAKSKVLPSQADSGVSGYLGGQRVITPSIHMLVAIPRAPGPPHLVGTALKWGSLAKSCAESGMFMMQGSAICIPGLSPTPSFGILGNGAYGGGGAGRPIEWAGNRYPYVSRATDNKDPHSQHMAPSPRLSMNK